MGLVRFLSFGGCLLSLLCHCSTSASEQSSRSNRLKRQSSDHWISRFGPQPGPQDQGTGPWGPWTEKSECSRTCGGGVAFQDRICMDTRSDGRYSCTGVSRRYFTCNTNDCPESSKDYRTQQCARFNTLPYEGKFYSWEPYYKAQNPCELNCMPKGQRFYTRMAKKVIDGTRCREDGSLDICIDAICMPVGCDKVLGSTAQQDVCGVCGGDGSSCRIIKGIFDKDNFDVGYNDILLIPVGATSIAIKEVNPTNNYLAVRNSAGEFYLNGNWRIQQPRELRFAGTLFRYDRKQQGPETLTARGPTTEPVFIVLLYQEKNLGIDYEYSIPVGASSDSLDTYSWTFGDFEECTQTCGGGVQYRPVRCIRSSNRDIVDDGLCDPLQKPSVNASCNTQSCAADWQIGEWSECSSPCGGGAQFRLVVCQQRQDGNVSSLVRDDQCPGPKPVFVRPCNQDVECPQWIANEWSECDATCGLGNKTRSIECKYPGDEDPTDASSCKPSDKPAEHEECSLAPCEGVEWIVSEWSGCDGSCSPRMESREAHCSNERGEVFPDSACEPSRLPQLTRACDSAAMCEPMWHTSEWSDCSVSCGSGVQSRVVFCGVWENESVIKIEAEKCTPEKKFIDVQNCSSTSCQGVWFTGPWTTCSAPCSGGTRSRKILCFYEDNVVDSGQCDPNEQPFDNEACNEKPCDEDEMMLLPNGCKDTKHGCCPDGMTTAGPDYVGCPTANITGNMTCEEADFGCCADGFMLALGPFRKGCPGISNCNTTKHGCCPDDTTPATGPDFEGCEDSNCSSSEFGCCPDAVTAASGPDLEGCDDGNCTNSTFGCCPDAVTAASGPDLEGCDDGNCTNSTFGCCPDSITPASGTDFEGCGESNCTNTTFGCCPDQLTSATGPDLEGCVGAVNCTNSTHGCCSDGETPATEPDFEGCETLESSGEDCYTTKFGCCPDKETQATGPDQEGCEEIGNSTDCSTSAFGCCEDGMVAAEGPFKAGCSGDEGSGEEDMSLPCQDTMFGCCADNETKAKGFEQEGCPIDCSNTTFGCCPDNVTVASGFDGEGCHCSNTTFGCCSDNMTAALGEDGEGCVPEDCTNSTFGCCPDNATIALGLDGEGCTPDDCTNSTFGCCPDNATIALGPDGEGCIPDDCTNSTFGCCPDNATIALGPDSEGCTPDDCINSTFGCCPDNVTLASGPNDEGCLPEDCTNSTFGCCPDNMTVALGEDNEGCDIDSVIDCANSTYGCCQDNLTVATGPDMEGCENVTNCTSSEFGCCPDEVSSATGPEFEGCDETILTTAESSTEVTTLAACANTMFGCCPDEVTVALGPTLQGCCFGMRFGCCPDNLTAALGPNFIGCGCQTYPYGCCPDNITPAQGFKYLGCRCEHFRYGCCQDKITAATGPHFEGCVCQLMAFGCCPDGVTPVKGPDGQGCGCDSTHYGCCPDGTTPARSADLSGCPCNTLPYGCCPDGATPARGPDLGSCPCTTFRFGCCSDGRTVARGPHSEGCPCETTRFGCCQDGRTPADGPEMRGCSCGTTPHGCCADGFTTARGPNQEGCPRVQTPSPEHKTDVCSLAKEKGPCRNYTVKWYFDVNYGSCTRFWYGGCDGNGNAFATQEECEGTCVNPDSSETCLLPKVIGPCEGKYDSWYYDLGTRACEAFTYSGCLGNNNRFASKDLCEQQCLRQQPSIAGNVCSLSKDEGPCDNTVIQWYYNSQNSRCEQFYYGGCRGNENRFASRGDCEQACLTATTTALTEVDVCNLPQKAGSCSDFRERWYHDANLRQCRGFYYSGCDGNANNFASFLECEQRCVAKVPATPEPPPQEEFRTEFCRLSQEPGPCLFAELNWYYDSSDGVCKEFYYGGCQGNQNRFKTRAECESGCGQSQDVCGLSMVKGSCSGSFNQWYYDQGQDECFEFLFSGCQGNANRFNNRESCYEKCKRVLITTVPPPIDDDVCQLPQDAGPCSAYYLMWFFDAKDNVCKTFVHGGCDGNGNRFDKRSECEQRCIKKTAREPSVKLPAPPTRSNNEDVCRLPVEAGPCGESLSRWFYDSQSQTCLPFVFGGCGGNKNRFKSADICLRFCTGIRAVPLEKKFEYQVPELSTPAPHCPPSNCGEIQCPYGIEESFAADGCSTCRCSNPCEVHNCPEGSRCAIEITRTSQEGTRTEPVCRRIQKPGSCSSPDVLALTFRDCDRRCRDDADCKGDHKCCSNGCTSVCAPPEDELANSVTEGVPTPAYILPGPNVSEGRVGEPAQLPCHAQGWPRPSVTWWRDATMLPLSSRRYEQLPDFALLIRSVVVEDTGDYSCFAYNGLGSGSTFKVTLIIDLSHESRESEPFHPDNVPLSVITSLVTRDPVSESPLQLDCAVEGSEAGTTVTWQFQDTTIQEDDRRRILSNHTLYITRSDAADSGEYRCTAEYAGHTASSSVSLTVRPKPTDSSCVDNPQFSNCEIIVNARYCNNKYYGKFCCASCMEAGQLQSWPIE